MLVEQVRSLRAGTRAEALRFARTCYDHLAGRVGVGVMDALVARGHVEQDAIGDGPPDRLSSPGRAMRYGLTGTGAAFVEQLGLDLDDLAPRRMAVGYCIDWSEQRPHLSGSVGAALTTWFFDAGWIERAPTTRAVRITDAGLTGFAGTFGVDATRERS